MISRYKPYYDREELVALFYSDGDVIEKFEERFAKFVGNKYAVSFLHARSALVAILKSLGIEHSEILIPSYTCIAIPSVIIASNNIPKFTDISLNDYNPTIDHVLSQVSKKTKSVIPCHMYGYPVKVKELKQKLDDDILIIDDAALALLTHDTGKYSDVTIYSLGPKQLDTFGGGVATTDNIEIYEKLKKYVSSNFSKNICGDIKKLITIYGSYLFFNNALYNIFNIWNEYERDRHYTRNFDTCEKHLPKDFLQLYSRIQAKIGLSQLKKAYEMIEKRKKIAEFYNKRLSCIENISLPPLIKGATYSCYTLRVKNRNEFVRELQKRKIQTDTIFQYSIPHLKTFKEYADKKFQNSLIASQNVVNLPCYPTLLDKTKELNHIVESIERCANFL